MHSKKAIGPVVATALLIVIAVSAVVGFQTWFNSYSSSTFSNVEQKSQTSIGVSGIENVIDDILYFKNTYDNLTINSIKIESNDCKVNGLYSIGINSISLGNNCTYNLSTSMPDVIVTTNKGVFIKKVYIKQKELEVLAPCSLDGKVVNSGSSDTFYKYDKPYNNLAGCSAISQVRTCTNGTLDGTLEYNFSTCSNTLAPSIGGEWVLVFGNSLYGTNDFYVMKYEAKNDGSDNPVSQATLTPWVSINQPNSIVECNSLDGTDSGDYHLISNTEWMTIARNVETVSSNWVDGIIGSTVASGGGLKRGNVGSIDSVSYNGADPEFGTGRNTLALLNLSTGEGIWDLNGNLHEWTSDVIDCSGGYPCSNLFYDSVLSSGWFEITSINTYGSLSYNLIRPSNSTWNSAHGMGHVVSDLTLSSDGSSNHAFLRGGRFDSGVYSGIYTLITSHGPTSSHIDGGFRCTYSP